MRLVFAWKTAADSIFVSRLVGMLPGNARNGLVRSNAETPNDCSSKAAIKSKAREVVSKACYHNESVGGILPFNHEFGKPVTVRW